MTIAECPPQVIELFKAIADDRDERFNNEIDDIDGDHEISVTVDSYEMLGWDDSNGEIIYTPFCDMTLGWDYCEAHHIEPNHYYAITIDDLGLILQRKGHEIKLSQERKRCHDRGYSQIR